MTSETTVANPVATRWARALHDLATQKDALDDVRMDMRLLAGEVAHPNVRAFLAQASVPKSQRLKAFGPILQKMSPWTRNLVNMAIERRRESLLVGLPDAFQAREDELSGVLKGHVECARELGMAEMQDLERSLEQRFNKKVVLKTKKNPDLVGGMRIFVGAQLIDRSVQGRLEELSRKLRGATLS